MRYLDAVHVSRAVCGGCDSLIWRVISDYYGREDFSEVLMGAKIVQIHIMHKVYEGKIHNM